LEETLNAMEEINWKKAMGPDLMISMDFNEEEFRNILAKAIVELLNNNIVPEYL
jgi:hypothetical protein